MSDAKPKAPLSKIRHDLRTPINQILGYSELLEEEAEEKGQPDFVPDLKKVQAAARRLLALIEEHFAPGKLVPAAAPAPETPARALPEPAPAAVASNEPTAAETKPTAVTAMAPDRAPGKSAERILVVDDNEMNRDMLARRLEAKGFEVETAEDGEQALDKIAARRPDLVLLDVMMPGLSGLDVLTRLRQEMKLSSADLPVIMATAIRVMTAHTAI